MVASPASRPNRRGSAARRRRPARSASTVGLVVLALLLLGCGGTAWWIHRPAPTAPPATTVQAPAAKPPTPRPAPRDPFLKAAGIHLRNDRGLGDIVPLRGANLGAWLVMEHWMCPMDKGGIKDHWTVLQVLEERFGAAEADHLMGLYQDTWIQEQDFVLMAKLGFNVVRIPVWYRNFEREDGTWRDDAFQRLDWAVATAWKHGIYSLIDLHGPRDQQRHDAHCTGRITPKATLWNNPAASQRTADLWAKIAAHYVGNPAVAGYDLLNEPMDVPSKELLWELSDLCIAAIRAKDPDHMITVENTFHSWNMSMLPDPKSRGWTNVSYQYHVYPWKEWDDPVGTVKATDGTIADWQARSAWQVPAQVGEFNMGNATGWNHAAEAYSNAGVSWMTWAWKTASNSTWGVYVPDKIKDATPNLRQDSLERITACWRAWGTERYRMNTMVAGSLAQPVAVDEEFAGRAGHALEVPAPGFLGNDSRFVAAGLPPRLTGVLIDQPTRGTLTLAPDGGFRYVPEPGFTGYDRFTYRVSDERTTSVRVATCLLHVTATAP